jgi:hypothetical protein
MIQRIFANRIINESVKGDSSRPAPDSMRSAVVRGRPAGATSTAVPGRSTLAGAESER